MDNKFLRPNSLNENYKLTRAASFSELSTTNKVVFEQRCKSDLTGNLMKQYSCEQIFDKKSNLSHLRVSRTLKSDNQERIDVWKTTVPYVSSVNSDWSGQPNMEEQSSSSNKYLALTGPDAVTPRQIIAPATLIINQNSSKDLNVNKQNIFPNYEQLNNEKTSEPVFQFKKPTCIQNNSNFFKINFNDEKKQIDEKNFLNNSNLFDQTNKSIFNNKTKQKMDTAELKTKLRSLIKKEEPKKESRTNFCWFVILIISVITVCIACLLNDEKLSSEFCKPRFKFNNIPEDLKKYVYGQDAAINDLIKYFNKKENQTGFDVLAFIGSTGVGKSYTAEVIKNKLKDTYNVLDYFHPFYEKENQVYTSLSVCQCNLIILENIKTDYISDALQFIEKLNSRVNNYCILILGLFNTQETNNNLKKNLDINKSLTLINKKLEDIDMKSTFVNFIKMDDQSLIKCIKDAADHANLELSNDEIEYVKVDLLRADSGCKGAHPKVQLLGKLKRAE